jgi:hypothetical protein
MVASLPTSASAGGSLASGAVGSDISWPQCGGALPHDPYSFGIIGVTGGHPFSGNDCFAAEYAWAQSTGTAQVYINLDYGLRTDGPLACLPEDTGCQAYDYGYRGAEWAYQYASQQTGGASLNQKSWWLDVETENYWSDDPVQNAYVIQGALDFLQRKLNKTTGVYSTSYQWGQIAGGYAPPGTPNWVAGANGLDDYGKCSASIWPGAPVWAIQYLNLDLDIDQNYAC